MLSVGMHLIDVGRRGDYYVGVIMSSLQMSSGLQIPQRQTLLRPAVVNSTYPCDQRWKLIHRNLGQELGGYYRRQRASQGNPARQTHQVKRPRPRSASFVGPSAQRAAVYNLVVPIFTRLLHHSALYVDLIEVISVLSSDQTSIYAEVETFAFARDVPICEYYVLT